MSNPKYTFYIVSRGRDHHYPVLMANNGKAALKSFIQCIHTRVDELLDERGLGHGTNYVSP